MFEIKIASGNHTALTVRIKDCPKSGLEAIDFRRANGLPDAPTNTIELTPFIIVDETLARELSEHLDSRGDYSAMLRFEHQKVARRDGSGICDSTSFDWYFKRYPAVPASVIKAWNASQTAESARALIRSIEQVSAEEQAFAAEELRLAAEEKTRKEQAIADARELLKDELSSKDDTISRLKAELADANAKIDELEEPSEIEE